jgi:hypothetical protein
MATVNKDFKIKSGLIVEGASGTINGNAILTENASDSYIIDLIGGETLVTSVDSTQLQVVGGELSVKSEVFDDFGSADAAESAANTYTDGQITSALTTAQGYADTAEGNANDYTDTAISSEVTNRNSAIDTAISTEVTNRNSAIDSAISTEVTNRNSAISTAKGEAIADAASYTDGEILDALTTAQGYATTAQGNAEDYTDTAISTEVTNRNSAIDSAISTEVTNRNSAIATAKGEANDYTDTAVANLVDGAPALLDTLNELAAALQDNPDIISDLQDIAAGKQDNLTAGTGITLDGATISVTASTYDAYGAADTAEGNANDYTDSAISTEVTNRNSAISTAKGEAISDANDYTDTAVSGALTTAQGYATTAEGNANDYTDTAISTEVTNRNSAIDTAISTEVTNRNSAIDSAINGLNTDDVEEGISNLYYTDSRVDAEVVGLLTNATLNNIQITADGYDLTITAENGVADSTTDDLAEGEGNLYFTNQRVLDAVDNAVINPQAVEINLIARQVASVLEAPTAGIQVGHAFAKADYRSAEFLVKVAYGTHTEISKVLLTLDTSDNIAITEYGIVGTNGSASSVSADISGDNVQLLVTTANNNSTVTVMGTLLA